MRTLRTLAALGLLAATGVASAGVTSTWTATNDYDFRGVTQTAKDPAIQASLDYAHDSGWNIGAWASNVDFGDSIDADVEVDLYTGFSGGEEVPWSVGLVYYTYPSSDDVKDFPEIFAGLGFGPVSGKLSYTNDQYGTDTDALYFEVNGTFELPANFSIIAHAGYAFGDFYDASDEPIDYSLGVGYKLGNFSLALKYVDTEIDDAYVVKTDENNNEGRVIFTIATTFPWGE